MNPERIRELQNSAVALTVEALKDEFEFLVQMRATFDQRLKEVQEQLRAFNVRTKRPLKGIPRNHPGGGGVTRDKLIGAFNGHAKMTRTELEKLGIRDQYVSYAERKGIVKRVGRGVYALVKR